MKGKYNMNTKGKIDFTKTDNIQFIEEVAIYLLMLPYQLISQQTMIFQIAP